MERNIDVIWRYLPIEDIIRLCETNSYFKKICEASSTWLFLLKRDFGIDKKINDPKMYYLMKYAQLKFINDYKVFLVNEDEMNIDSIYARDINEVYSKFAVLYNNNELEEDSRINYLIISYIYDVLEIETPFNYQITSNDIKEIFKNLELIDFQPRF